jgi:hypothetical protein
MNAKSLGRHVSFGVDVPMKGAPRQRAILNLYTANLYNAVTRIRGKTCGFCIKNDMAHCRKADPPICGRL